MPLIWDIFCKVIDNYGDAGVVLRLARSLVQDRQRVVRIFTDQMPLFLTLMGDDAPLAIALYPMDQPQSLSHAQPLVVIESFACGLPDWYLQAVWVDGWQKALWINLDYFSAEPWVDACHGQRSPHPQYPYIERYFFFPGVSNKTGGLLRPFGVESQPKPLSQEVSSSHKINILVFAYPMAPLLEVFQVWAKNQDPVHVWLADSTAWQTVIHHCPPHLPMTALPFMAQSQFDDLMAQMDLVFVRGEDSFTQALQMGKPLIWNIYPQESAAHLQKLDAFLTRYAAPDHIRSALKTVMIHWNQLSCQDEAQDFTRAWQTLMHHWAVWQTHAQQYCQLIGQQDLCANLVAFVQTKRLQ